jgi:hypothetical protein
MLRSAILATATVLAFATISTSSNAAHLGIYQKHLLHVHNQAFLSQRFRRTTEGGTSKYLYPCNNMLGNKCFPD